MLQVLRYFPVAILELTWEIESHLEVSRTSDGPHRVTVQSNGLLALELINDRQFRD
jgi:hypothetical protein